MAKLGILGWAERITSTTALANHPGVLIVAGTAAAQIEGCLDATPANLHIGGAWIGHVLLGEFAAHSKGTISSTVAKDWLILDVDLLIVIQLQLLLRTKSISCKEKRCCNEDVTKLHCVS